jgi:hypothetical protein
MLGTNHSPVSDFKKAGIKVNNYCEWLTPVGAGDLLLIKPF